MLYDLNFLRRGADFPPKSEVKRLEAYRLNQMLLEDEAWSALAEYRNRVLYLLSNFSLSNPNAYLFSANYWLDIVTKTQELIYGNEPAFTTANEDDLTSLLTETELVAKAKEGIADFVGLGDWVTKAIETPNGYDFININPANWFPIVSRENVKDIKAHVLAWIVPIGDKFELHVQIHEKGKYTNKAFAVKSYNPDAYYVIQATNQKVKCPTYELGDELAESKTDFKLGVFNTGLNDFVVISSANNAGTRSVYGTSDFDQVTDAIMEYNVRQTLKNVVLDKHSAPKMYGPMIAGDDALGNYIEVENGATVPNYLVWDASMQSVQTTIDSLKEDIANLSGLGSLLNSKTFGESQGYDALMIKLSPAIMRSAGKKVILEKHLKRLISLISGKYGQTLKPSEISVIWHDGIPTTESVRADIALKHLSSGWSTKNVLIHDYGWDEEKAEINLEDKRIEQPAIPSFGMDEGGEFGE